MNGANVIGQTLDEKYKIESEIGKGGMGTVYLATHVGTERPVALKVIAPEFMQRLEFVERFKREARAAGRLRHPNVVDVTDFGFADTPRGKVAYLVMEYLDGCTLGEVLEEEGKLPLAWTLDILEQVCSAVEEAHGQGIIHRDLKPDNIWLEPNQRGGYTVKVLDFGIAKLEEHIRDSTVEELIDISVPPNFQSARATVADAVNSETIAENRNATLISEAATMAQLPNIDTEAGTLVKSGEIDSESGTAIFSANHSTQSENVGTLLISEKIETNKSDSSAPATAELTRVGAVLGTPLYMSPEQCRGERLNARSDVYSLGVIAYQMLAGQTPFSGDYVSVMKAHQETEPPKLEAKKVPRKIKRVISAALAKQSETRPPTAQIFASELRAQSEGIGALLRRSLTIYSEHLPKFLGLAVLLYIPLVLITILKVFNDVLYGSEAIGKTTNRLINIAIYLAMSFVGIICGYLVIGTTTFIVSQVLAMPLRPVRLRPALAAARKKWKTFTGTGLLSTVLIFLGLFACGIGFPILSILYALVGPVVMMENLRGRPALKRSKKLVMRSPGTTTAGMFIMFLAPAIVGALISFFVATTIKSVSDTKEKVAVARQKIDSDAKAKENFKLVENREGINFNFGDDAKADEESGDKPQLGGINGVVHDAATQVLILPLQILFASFSSIVIALLYLKTRQAGGESMQDLLAQFEEADHPRSNWQRRVRKRLAQSGRITSKT